VNPARKCTANHSLRSRGSNDPGRSISFTTCARVFDKRVRRHASGCAVKTEIDTQTFHQIAACVLEILRLKFRAARAMDSSRASSPLRYALARAKRAVLFLRLEIDQVKYAVNAGCNQVERRGVSGRFARSTARFMFLAAALAKGADDFFGRTPTTINVSPRVNPRAGEEYRAKGVIPDSIFGCMIGDERAFSSL